jgi:hypothetical protein
LLCPSTEKKDKILSAHNQIDAGNLLSNVNVCGIGCGRLSFRFAPSVRLWLFSNTQEHGVCGRGLRENWRCLLIFWTYCLMAVFEEFLVRAIEDSKAYRSLRRLTFVISPFPKNQIECGAWWEGGYGKTESEMFIWSFSGVKTARSR